LAVPATHTLSEWDSKRLLAHHGVPMGAEALARTPEEAATAATQLGLPAVAKLCGASIAHKSERGLVRLGLATSDAVERAAADLLAAAGPNDGEVAVLVAPMVRGNRELIAGVHRDPQFGPCVMVGVGGILAEVVGDVSFRLVPLEPVDAEEMVDDLASQTLLAEVRGEPAVDREKLAEVLLGLSRLAEDRPDVVSVDINPLIVAGGVPVPVDALVELDGPPS
jgi:acetyl-CoA synthetase (ADP-forming)